jgi:hypothetical protein
MAAETARRSYGYVRPTLAGPQDGEGDGAGAAAVPEISPVGAAGDADLNRRRRLLQW